MSKEVLERLRQIVDEWLQAADGEPLEDIHASVGLVLQDVFSALGIEPETLGM